MKRKPPRRRKFEPIPPAELPEEEAKLFRNEDYIGWEYYHCERIRQMRKPTAGQLKRLAEHDEDEKRIHADPRAVMREAHEALDRGSSLLLKLIRAGNLRHVLEPTEKGRAEGVRAQRSDQAAGCLFSRINYLNRQLIRLAQENVPEACRSLWFEAKALAEAFTRLALVWPEEFREVADDALTMPSLRGRERDFSADADAIVRAIHLGENHPAPDIWDNKSRVGALCHVVVASIIDEIFSARRHYEWERETHEMLKQFHETEEEYRGVTLEQALRSKMHPTIYEHYRACAELPDWNEDAAAWWKGRVLPMVKERFERLAEEPASNPALWAELQRGGERDSRNDMRRYMEKICRDKFNQIIRRRP